MWSQERTAHLMDLLYQTTLAPELGQPFLTELCRETGAHVGAILVHDMAAGAGAVAPVAVGVDALAIFDYESRYAAENIWVQRTAHRLHASSAVRSDDWVSLPELQQTGYWKEFLRPIDVSHSMGACGLNEDGRTALLSVCRSFRKGAFDDREFTLLRTLAPHWANVCAIQRKLLILEQRSTAREAALDQLELAVFFLGPDEQVAFANTAAHEFLASAATLVQKNGRLCARDRKSDQAFRAAINSISEHPVKSVPTNLLFVLRNAEGIATAIAAVHQLSGDARGTKALLVQNLTPHPDPTMQAALAHLFGLTSAEARLAVAMRRHASITDAAADLGLTAGTARERLKVIYQKANVDGQVALILMLERISGVRGRHGYAEQLINK
ncbi:MAG: hypothetical protein JNN30_01790 [Rhodanobacteraceae bacterium]|nr:hypothetical protein [Rhodanobacteraceae bacterium]